MGLFGSKEEKERKRMQKENAQFKEWKERVEQKEREGISLGFREKQFKKIWQDKGAWETGVIYPDSLIYGRVIDNKPRDSTIVFSEEVPTPELEKQYHDFRSEQILKMKGITNLNDVFRENVMNEGLSYFGLTPEQVTEEQMYELNTLVAWTRRTGKPVYRGYYNKIMEIK